MSGNELVDKESTIQGSDLSPLSSSSLEKPIKSTSSLEDSRQLVMQQSGVDSKLSDHQPVKESMPISSKLIPVPKLQGKSPATLIKHLDYLSYLGNTLNELYQLLQGTDETKKRGIFYRLVILGEIVAKQEKLPPKLPDSIRGLLPKKACSVLQDIRDNQSVHGAFFLSKEEDRLYNALKKDHKSIGELTDYVNKFCSLNTINIAYAWLIQLDEQGTTKFSKWRFCSTQISHVIKLSSSNSQLLSERERVIFSEKISKMQELHQGILNAIRSDEGKKDSPASNELIKSEGYKTSIEYLKKDLLEIQKIPLQDCLLNFCNEFKEELLQLSKTIKSSDKELKSLRDKHCLALNEILTAPLISQLQGSELKDSDKVSLLYAARWHVILIFSLLEQINPDRQSLPSKLNQMRQLAVHSFDNPIHLEREFEQIKSVLENELLCYLPQGQRLKRKSEEAEHASGEKELMHNIKPY